MPSETIEQPTTAVPGAAQVAVPREPSATELATEFVADPSLLSESESSEQVVVDKKVESKPTEKKEVKEVDGKPISSAKPKEEVKSTVSSATKDDKKVAEVKKEEKPVAAVPGEVKPILPLSAQPKARDYTGFSAEEQSVLKAMSNEAFEYTTKLIKERKELSALKDASYLQHPQAYTLSPEYSKLQEEAYYLNAEAQFWQQQSLAIAEGKDWHALQSWDLKTGQPIVGPPQKASTEAGKNADRYALHLFNKAQGVNEQIQQFSGRYKQQVDSDNAAIQQECARRFGWVADPKLLDEKIVNPAVGEKTIKQVREDFIGLFPIYHQNSVGVQVAAHLFAALQIYGQKIHELENNKQVAAVKEEEKTLIETTPKDQPTVQKEVNGHMAGQRGMWETKEFSTEGMPV